MSWTRLIIEPLQMLVFELRLLIPKMLGALVVVLVGWLIAQVFRTLVVRVLHTLGLERLAEKAHLSDILRKGAIRLTVVELLGELTYWLLMIATAIVALQVVGVTAAPEWLERFGAFLPRIVLSVVVLLFGMLLASFLGATVRAASLNAGFPQGHLVGQVVHVTVLLVTVIVALEQLEVVTRTIEIALYILLGTFGLSFALALGLGAQGFVKRFLEDYLWEKWKSSRP